ncbi:MAG: MarP family serine protease [Solirubrobacteraceae bacterium]
MTGVDLIITGFAVIFGLIGFARGFFVGVLSLAGFVAGIWLGTRLGPQLLSEGNRSPYAPLFGLFGAVAAGTIISAGAEGIAGRMRAGMRSSALGAVDGLLGAALAVVLALAFTWVVGVIVVQTPGVGDLRRDVQRSQIIDRLNEVLPADTLLKALARFDPFPRVDGPEVDVGPPQSRAARDPDVQRAGNSVVKILGSACGRGVSGSGWVAADGIVVTNAHVVAGQQDTVVAPREGNTRLGATAIAFDVRNDVAVLRVPGLDRAPLPFAREVKATEPGAVAGYPLSGPFALGPARIGQTRVVLSQDAYGRGPVRRRITAFRGNVQPGNSGGPIVDIAGRVSGTVFAQAVGSTRQGGYAVPNDVVRRVLARASGRVDTGPCAS